MFEAENCQRLETPSWCNGEHCTLKPRAIELFNGCCGEALKNDKYDASLKDTDAQLQGEKCLRTHRVKQNSKRTCCDVAGRSSENR